jgi:hypothetical protein
LTPFPRYLHHLPGGEGMRLEFFEKYRANWSLPDGGPGYSEVLRQGATYFTSDDHELWNNAPNKTPVVLKTWFGPWRQEWYDTASELYDAFQTSARMMGFSVGRLSFLVADLRLDRTADRSRLQRMDHRASSIGSMACPGRVLVLGSRAGGQAGWKGNIADWGLPTTDSTGRWWRRYSVRHDVVVLTGDVHFGRVAGAPAGGANPTGHASPSRSSARSCPGGSAARAIPEVRWAPWGSGYRDDYRRGRPFTTVAFQDGGRLRWRDRLAHPQLGQPLVAGPQWGTYLS